MNKTLKRRWQELEGPYQILEEDEFQLGNFIRNLWTKKRFLIVVSVVSFVLGSIYSFAPDELYKTRSTMYQTQAGQSNPMGGLQDIAATFGVNMNASSGGFSVPDVITSRDMRLHILELTVFSTQLNDSLSYFDYLDAKYPASNLTNVTRMLNEGLGLSRSGGSADGVDIARLRKQEDFLKLLRQRVKVDVVDDTGLIEVSFIAEEPGITLAVMRAIQTRINEFANEQRKEEANRNIEFIQSRIQTTSRDLMLAEENVKRFREQNANITDSPDLQMQLLRLQRESELLNQIYISLYRQLELAQIEQDKKTAAIIVLDNPTLPVRPFTPRKKQIALLATFLGFTFGVIMVFLANYPLMTLFPGASQNAGRPSGQIKQE